MFEAQVLQLLRQYLGEYVHGLSAEALKISVWQGDVVLKDLQLKAEALNSLKLPLTVKAGFLGSVTLKVPWNKLGKEPVVVLLDRIFILAEPIVEERTSRENEKEKLLEAKRRRLEEAEMAMLEAKEKRTAKAENTVETTSWLASLISTIIGNLKISITNVHIRYEDSTSNSGKPFCAGIMLSRLAAVTVDENGKETFVSSGALDKLHKSFHLERLAVYHDSGKSPWNIGKKWSEMSPKQWCEIFESGINQNLTSESSSTKAEEEHQYLLRPVNGVLNYHRHGKKEQRDPNTAFQNISLVLNEVSLSISEAQYCDGLKFLEGVSLYRRRIEFSHFRPWVPVSKDPQVWWMYACQAGLKQHKKTWSRLCWQKVDRLCHFRRKYVQLYAELLQRKAKSEITEINQIEEEVDTEVLLLWRLLARAKAESSKSKESSSQQSDQRKSGWWGFGWRKSIEEKSNLPEEASTEKQERDLGDFTKEEWAKINELLNYNSAEDVSSVQEPLDSLQMCISATVKETSIRIFDEKRTEILGGSFIKLSAGLKLYPKTWDCRVKLESYGLSGPEGSLIKSVSDGDNEQVLEVHYVYRPLNSELDWKLSATILPCYVTVFTISFERFSRFLKSGHAVSPDVVSETAAALQNRLEKVRKAAQEQLKLALEEESRFSIYIDFDAPKIRIPANTKLTNGSDTQLLLDLGHFTLHTENKEKQADETFIGTNLYSQWYISGSDIAAFLVDGSYDWSELQLALFPDAGSPELEHGDAFRKGAPELSPVLDRCGMFLLFEKLKIPHPVYPSTHVALKVPHLGLHFSPGRYQRLMQLLATFDGSNNHMTEKVPTEVSWYPADHESSARVLVWKGLGNAVAEWQPCWIVLSASYLYVLESQNSQSYQRSCSLTGKQVLEVPPGNIGGSEFVLALCNRGVELQKGLETSSSIILNLADEEEKETWLRLLTSEIYKCSTPSTLTLPDYFMNDVGEMDVSEPVDFMGQPVLYVVGSLGELQISLYGVRDADICGEKEEMIILNLEAGGGKVNVLQRQYDLSVVMNLDYLKIEDKLQGSTVASCRYIARSIISDSRSGTDRWQSGMPVEPCPKSKDDNDIYDDALAEFGGSPSLSPEKRLNSIHVGVASPCIYSITNLKESFLASGLEHFHLTRGESLLEKIFSENNGSVRSFVRMHIIIRQVESPDYDDVDVQMIMSMSTLEFFCNRRTVVALIDFGTKISETVDQQNQQSGNSRVNETSESDIESVAVKGLLGKGKSRTVFKLKMDIDSVRIYLNLENGTQLAMLDQEKFHMELKVFPGSFGITGMLGNLRICDMTLGRDHHWGWMCDIRDPGSDSLVKLEFMSFNADEDDYQGYDYSLEGSLSSVRIIFLYRFIQEVTAYFASLSAPNVHQLTHVVKVGGIERLVPQSDIDGLPALRLNVSLESPIIIMPKCSSSKEFMQLDLGFLNVSNKFEWHGGSKENASAVHLDVLSTEISGINLVVGVDGIEGKSMIQEVQGLHVTVQRPLRDLFRKFPEVQINIEVAMLRGIMSDKEYLVVTGCAATNIAELPHIPTDFRTLVMPGDLSRVSMDTIKVPEQQKNPVNASSGQSTSTWTTVRVVVEVKNAELELQNGWERESSLACVELQGLWLSYRTTSQQEMEVLLTLPRLRVLDLRAGTKPEMRLMLGSMVDIECTQAGNKDDKTRAASAQPPMLVMDARVKQGSQAYMIRLQRIRLLVVIDFLLAVGEFFVPSLSSITGKEEDVDCSNDPLIMQEHLRLLKPIHTQEEAILKISSRRKLIVDYPDIDEFIYDGCGNTLILDVKDDSAASKSTIDPLIVVGTRKKLIFKNIKIKNGFILKDHIQLQPFSSYCTMSEDGVVLFDDSNNTNNQSSYGECLISNIESTPENSMSKQDLRDVGSNLILEVQAIAPELTFYDSERLSYASLNRREKLLRLKMDVNVMYACKENDVWLRGHVKRLSMDAGSGLTVVDPMVIAMEYACVKDRASLNVHASAASVQLSFSLIRLLLRLHSEFINTFEIGGGHVLTGCSHFDRIWVNTEHRSGQRCTIWRPRAPSGYAIVGDCITSGEAPPSQAVMAIKRSFYRVKKTVAFSLVWTFYTDATSKDLVKGCSIWMPVPPPGYAALGCVASLGSAPPALGTVYCVRSDLVTSAAVHDCVLFQPSQAGTGSKFSIWRIDNGPGSFYAHQSSEQPSRRLLYDFRDILYEGRRMSDTPDSRSKMDTQKTSRSERKQSLTGIGDIGLPGKEDRLISTTAKLERMWWDTGCDNRRAVSIWRPIPPPGYAIVGDHITEGLEPPSVGIIVKDDNSGRLAPPVRFAQCMHSLGKEEIYAWHPVAPTGYVTLGCVVTKTDDTTSLSTIRCVRTDLATEVNISRKPVWSVSGSRSGYNCSIWRLHSQANTFLARPEVKRPPARFAYGLVEDVNRRSENNSSADIKIPKISITIIDDLRGTVTPLANITVTNINLAANGRPESFSSVCIASLAASTFNTHLESWEPLIEHFDGIFKYESHDSQSGSAFKVGQCFRITAVTIVNLNITHANIDSIINSISSWKRQSELELLALSRIEADNDELFRSQIGSALEEDDSEKLILQNELGTVVYIRTFEHRFRDCILLEHGNNFHVCMPPPNFGDTYVTGGLKIPFRHVAIHVSAARGLPLVDDGNGQEYFYSLHVSPIKHSHGIKTPSQSARSRCVCPSFIQHGDSVTVASAWNEVFIFDFPEKGATKVEIRLSNKAAFGGKGELLGSVSIPLDSDANPSFWKLIRQSLSQVNQTAWPLVQEKVFPLEYVKKQAAHTNSEPPCVVVSIYYFTEKTSRVNEEIQNDKDNLQDTGLQISFASSGPWLNVRSVLPLGTLPIHNINGYIAMDVALREGKKLATLRSLVTVYNETDNILEVCVCPSSLLTSPDIVSFSVESGSIVVHEVFENQRYQPLLGWGSRWPGNFLPNDPGRWSTRDCQRSYQSKEDLQPSLPPGWMWTTEWVVDKAGYVDEDGWAYSPDFQSLRWPPNSMKYSKKSPLDFIRRRRWIRTRQRMPVTESNQRQILSLINPGQSIPVPVSYLQSHLDYCVQVRPQLESTSSQYLWSRTVSHLPSRRPSQSNKTVSVIQLFMLKHLEKMEEQLMCPPANPSSSRTAWWLSMESDANILYNEFNSPVYDWKLSVTAPLRIENLLPCNAEYSIWEKGRDSNPIQRDRGVVSAGGVSQIFSVDTRRQIYITWFVQGGWIPEKELVLVSDPMADTLPSTLSLINQQSGRKLQLSLERGFGSTYSTVRTLRVFVPYWICNKAALPLSYCVVEVEPTKGSDGETPWLIRAVKAAKNASSRPSHSKQNKISRVQQVIQCLEYLEYNGGNPTMWSPQTTNKSGFMSFAPRPEDGVLSPRLGISVCCLGARDFKSGISFRNLEDNERLVVKAMDESGSYYKLSVFLSMSSDRTKVVNFQPHTLFVNRLGQELYMRQGDLDCAELLYPNDPPKAFLWQSDGESELIKVCLGGYNWSTPFTVDTEGVSHILLQNQKTRKKLLIRAEIRNGTTESRFLVIFRHVALSSPYRIENQSMALPMCIRQIGGTNDSWQTLLPGSAIPFAWEDLQREHKLEIMVAGAEPSTALIIAIDESADYHPNMNEIAPVAAFHVKVYKEEGIQVIKICDWLPSNEELPIVPYGGSTKTFGQEQVSSVQQNNEEQVHLLVELAELGISLVDHTPEELLYLSIQNFSLSYATGLGSGISRLKVRCDGIQLDNQLPLTPMPVLFCTQIPSNALDAVLKCTITMQDDMSSNRYVYPYVGVHVSSANTMFLINIHEPVIWRLHQMFSHLNLNRLSSSGTTDVSVDPIIYIGLLHTSEIRFKVSMIMSPTQRPRGALGFWASLITALGNTDDLQVRIMPRIHEDICMRQSSLLATCMAGLKKDILSHPLLLLSGVDILGNASSALGHMSKGVAALSMDKKFIKSRQRQDVKPSVEGFGDGFREGAEAFGKGLFRGVTGILTKPLEGARSSGVEGFVQGVGKGIIGVAAQPVSGVLDLLSKTAEGANAMKTKLTAVITSEGVLLRRRLPRVIGADNILRPYDKVKAEGQILLQLAEVGSGIGSMDIFKVRGKFAMTDAYEDHYNLPKGRTLIITHRRVILLQHPTSIIVQKKPDLMKDPCSVLWDVLWKDITLVELKAAEDDRPSSPSRVILNFRSGVTDKGDFKHVSRIIKCYPDSDQAERISARINQVMSVYGSDQTYSATWRLRQNSVRNPYSEPVEGHGTSYLVNEEAESTALPSGNDFGESSN